jgi:hypothetical protein
VSKWFTNKKEHLAVTANCIMLGMLVTFITGALVARCFIPGSEYRENRLIMWILIAQTIMLFYAFPPILSPPHAADSLDQKGTREDLVSVMLVTVPAGSIVDDEWIEQVVEQGLVACVNVIPQVQSIYK